MTTKIRLSKKNIKFCNMDGSTRSGKEYQNWKKKEPNEFCDYEIFRFLSAPSPIPEKELYSPIGELYKCEWEKILELNEDNYKNFLQYHYDAKAENDKWFKFVIMQSQDRQPRFWFLPGNKLDNKHSMATVKHLYEHGGHKKFKELVDIVLKDKRENTETMTKKEYDKLLELMENFNLTAGKFEETKKISTVGFNLNCLSVLASGSGSICLKTPKIELLGNDVRIPMVFLNTKSGHYQCSQVEINNALDTLRVEHKEDTNGMKQIIKTRETLKEYLETLKGYIYKNSTGIIYYSDELVKLKPTDTISYFRLKFADIKEFSGEDEYGDIYSASLNTITFTEEEEDEILKKALLKEKESKIEKILASDKPKTKTKEKILIEAYQEEELEELKKKSHGQAKIKSILTKAKNNILKKGAHTFVGATTCSELRDSLDSSSLIDMDNFNNYTKSFETLPDTLYNDTGPLGLESRILYNCCNPKGRSRKANKIPELPLKNLIIKPKMTGVMPKSIKSKKKGGFRKRSRRKSIKIKKYRHL